MTSSAGSRHGDDTFGYVNEHPVVFSLAVGGALVGFVGTAFPTLIESSSLVRVLGSLELTVWLLMHALGSLAFIVGVLRLNPQIEAAGAALLSATFAVVVVTTLAVVGSTALAGVLWLGCVAFGFAWRCRSLIHLYPRGGIGPERG